jgi:heme O synthase-like polyprenyltransferase
MKYQRINSLKLNIFLKMKKIEIIILLIGGAIAGKLMAQYIEEQEKQKKILKTVGGVAAGSAAIIGVAAGLNYLKNSINNRMKKATIDKGEDLTTYISIENEKEEKEDF